MDERARDLRPIWIQIWIDDGTITANDLFNPDLAVENMVLDDEDLWNAYETAVEAMRRAKRAVLDATRNPSEEERLAYRERIVAALKDQDDGT